MLKNVWVISLEKVCKGHFLMRYHKMRQGNTINDRILARHRQVSGEKMHPKPATFKKMFINDVILR